jgi:hypothetical protein
VRLTRLILVVAVAGRGGSLTEVACGGAISLHAP